MQPYADPYLQQMYLQGTPDEETQRATANALRGNASVGGRLSTSSIPEVSKQGTLMQNRAGVDAQQIGLMQTRAAQIAADEASDAARLAAITGNDDFYKVTGKQQTKLENEALEFSKLEGMVDNFQDDFSGIPFLSAGSNAYTSAGFPSTDEQKAQNEWWTSYKKYYENIERHELFGSALTQSEQAQWKRSNIREGMDPEQIKSMLGIQRMMAQKIQAKRLQIERAKGRSEEWLESIYGDNLPEHAFNDPRGYAKELTKDFSDLYGNTDSRTKTKGSLSELTDNDLYRLYSGGE